MNTYPKNAVVRLYFRLYDFEEAAADPDEMTVKIKKPGGTTLTYVYGTNMELVRDDTGVYYADVSLDRSGIWTYGVKSTGEGAGGNEDQLKVLRSSLF